MTQQPTIGRNEQSRHGCVESAMGSHLEHGFGHGAGRRRGLVEDGTVGRADVGDDVKRGELVREVAQREGDVGGAEHEGAEDGGGVAREPPVRLLVDGAVLRRVGDHVGLGVLHVGHFVVAVG